MKKVFLVGVLYIINILFWGFFFLIWIIIILILWSFVCCVFVSVCSGFLRFLLIMSMVIFLVCCCLLWFWLKVLCFICFSSVEKLMFFVFDNVLLILFLFLFEFSKNFVVFLWYLVDISLICILLGVILSLLVRFFIKVKVFFVFFWLVLILFSINIIFVFCWEL